MASANEESPRPAATQPFRWNEIREQYLKLLGEFYVLTIKQLLVIFDLPDNDNSRRNIQYVLSRLMEVGYVDRLRFIDEFDSNSRIVYAYFVTHAGAKVLEDPATAYTPESKFIARHEVEITWFHTYLKAWCEQHGLNLQWKQPKMNHRRKIIPDAYFGIKDPAKNEGRNVWHYFLELERAKIGNYHKGKPSIVARFEKYDDYYESKECERDWGIKQFRVVFIVRNAVKQCNLAARDDVPRQRTFWIGTEPAFKMNIGGTIFCTPKDRAAKAFSFADPANPISTSPMEQS